MPGKDSIFLIEIGVETVMVSLPDEIAMIKKDHSGTMDTLLGYFDDMDLVITEGYK